MQDIRQSLNYDVVWQRPDCRCIFGLGITPVPVHTCTGIILDAECSNRRVHRPQDPDEANGRLNALYNSSYVNGAAVAGPHSVLKNFVNKQPFFWGSSVAATDGSYFVWQTDALDNNNQYAYPVGTYTVCAESISTR